MNIFKKRELSFIHISDNKCPEREFLRKYNEWLSNNKGAKIISIVPYNGLLITYYK